MKKLSWVLIPAFIFLAAPACKKSSTPTKTKTELITQGSWRFDNAKVNGADVSAFINACQKDNVVTFAANGNGTADEGPTKCNANDPQTSNFNWNFASNETILHVSTIFFTGGSSDFVIVSLNETNLVVSQDVNFGGSTQNAVVTFKH